MFFPAIALDRSDSHNHVLNKLHSVIIVRGHFQLDRFLNSTDIVLQYEYDNPKQEGTKCVPPSSSDTKEDIANDVHKRGSKHTRSHGKSFFYLENIRGDKCNQLC